MLAKQTKEVTILRLIKRINEEGTSEIGIIQIKRHHQYKVTVPLSKVSCKGRYTFALFKILQKILQQAFSDGSVKIVPLLLSRPCMKVISVLNQLYWEDIITIVLFLFSDKNVLLLKLLLQNGGPNELHGINILSLVARSDRSDLLKFILKETACAVSEDALTLMTQHHPASCVELCSEVMQEPRRLQVLARAAVWRLPRLATIGDGSFTAWATYLKARKMLPENIENYLVMDLS